MTDEFKEGLGLEKLDWIKLKKEMGSQESSQQRLTRKMKENALIPIGILFTTGALMYGLNSFRKGDKVMQQRMMRFRVVGQSFTLVAFVAGIMMTFVKN